VKNPIKRISQSALKGLVVSWKDRAKSVTDTDIFERSAYHKNPHHRLYAADIVSAAHEHIVNRRYKWAFKVESIFDNPDIDKPDIITGEFTTWCSFDDVAAACVNIHSENLEEGGEEFYLHTVITAECIEVPKVPFNGKKPNRKKRGKR
tara:strand:+ start:118 stop:564 length:447 start_codon:yes stop_codon:yes gene_type:complete